MQALPKPLRKSLEDAVIKAREVAEAGAREALEYLGVAEATLPKHLNDDQRALRGRLRAHGRALGDVKRSDGTQKLAHLVNELAYEHWHTMLFARFLAETGLLMHPEGVAVSLEECKELAPEEGFASSWLLAGHYASRMLPQVFRQDSPGLAVSFAPNHQQKLEKLLNDLDPETFQASDSLGWVYQFWQTKKKDEVNKSEVKIGADELPAVTQLFTEDYMVSFLLDNSLGAWWAGRRLSENDLKNATSEQELREKASLPGVPLEYLRFVKTDEGVWEPAAGTFEQWPKALVEIRTLDPCCGSGHFLVAALLMLVPMRMEEEGLTAREAVDHVLQENIHGLELDQRCVELAAFALAFTAWRYADAGGYRPLPELNLACSGLSIGIAKEEWKQLALNKKNLTIAMDWLYETFRHAPVLGSLLDPTKSDAARIVQWEELNQTLDQALKADEDESKQEASVIAHGLAKTAQLLGQKYTCIVTNVPYLARGKQDEVLQKFCERYYPEAKNDLATVFLERCLELCEDGGTSSIVLPQNWLFLSGYQKLRKKLLKRDRWNIIGRLGPKAFQTPMWDFNVLLTIFSRRYSGAEPEGFVRGLDVSELRSAEAKAAGLLAKEMTTISQARQLDNPNCRFSFKYLSSHNLLAGYASSIEGLTTGDMPRFISYFWERPLICRGWSFYIGSTQRNIYFAGREQVVFWQNGSGVLSNFPSAHNFPSEVMNSRRILGKKGIRISQMGNVTSTIFTGEVFDKNAATVVPHDDDDNILAALWCFAADARFKDNVREIDQALKITNASFLQIEFDEPYWSKVSAEKYPNGLPKPYSDDPTQWIFHGHPCGSVVWDEGAKWTTNGPLRTDDTVLQVALARLLGYRWPAELADEMELGDEQRAWVTKCEELISCTDDDGIVCLPAIRGEAAAHERVLKVLESAYGAEWKASMLSNLLESSGCKGKSLEFWLHDKFFAQHCKLFNNKPFIWHVWDGLKDGFSALVNYHLLDRANLERLIYTYLGDWIRMQERGVGDNVSGSHERLAAAEGLKKRLENILEGEAPLDIYVRWKPLDQQPVGWDPNLNDGVRLNIRPFMSVDDVGKKGAGVLRTKPNIHWKKDRGKDVASAPWYPVFEGKRINDHHLTLAEKQNARQVIKEPSS